MSKKQIVKVGNRLQSLQYADLHKINKTGLKGRCSYCYEKTIFRVVQLDRVNQLACTMCLKSARLYKTEPIKNNRMIFKGKLTFEQKLERQLNRIAAYFTGNHVYYAFKIRRRSKLGVKITNFLVKIKGIKNA